MGLGARCLNLPHAAASQHRSFPDRRRALQSWNPWLQSTSPFAENGSTEKDEPPRQEMGISFTAIARIA